MILYGFYSSIDSEKEIIGKKNFATYMDALKHFSIIKNLSVADFLELYTIIQIK